MSSSHGIAAGAIPPARLNGSKPRQAVSKGDDMSNNSIDIRRLKIGTTKSDRKYVYLMVDEYRIGVKIGVSQNWRKRKYQIQREYNRHIGEVWVYLADDCNQPYFEIEKRLHKRFSEFHGWKEWFYVNNDIDKFLVTNCLLVGLNNDLMIFWDKVKSGISFSEYRRFWQVEYFNKWRENQARKWDDKLRQEYDDALGY